MSIFPRQRTQHINVWRMVGWKIYPQLQVCGSLCMSGTMLRQSQGLRQVHREHAECFLSIVRHTNAEQPYHQWGQITYVYHTIVRRGPPSLFRQLHVVRFLCRHEKNMRTYGDTKWTYSQSLTVLERTISHLQA